MCNENSFVRHATQVLLNNLSEADLEKMALDAAGLKYVASRLKHEVAWASNCKLLHQLKISVTHRHAQKTEAILNQSEDFSMGFAEPSQSVEMPWKFSKGQLEVQLWRLPKPHPSRKNLLRWAKLRDLRPLTMVEVVAIPVADLGIKAVVAPYNVLPRLKQQKKSPHRGLVSHPWGAEVTSIMPVLTLKSAVPDEEEQENLEFRESQDAHLPDVVFAFAKRRR